MSHEGLQAVDTAQSAELLNDYEKEGIAMQTEALRYADLTSKVMDKLPNMLRDDVVDFEENFGALNDEEARYIHSILETFQETKRQVDTLLDELPVEGKELATYLYNAVLKRVTIGETLEDDRKIQPAGTIGMYTSNPFAIAIFVDDEDDLKRVYESSGYDLLHAPLGFYRDSEVFVDHELVPIVCIGTTREDFFNKVDATLIHENNHAMLRKFINANEKNKGNLKSEYLFLTNNAGEQLNRKFDRHTYEDEQDVIDSKEWEYILHHTLWRSADEVLAEYEDNLTNHADYVRKQVDSYNYLEQEGIKNKDLREIVLKDYQSEFDRNIGETLRIIERYRSDPIWKDRDDVFKYVLYNVPVNRWSKFLHDTMFTGEIDEYSAIEQQIRIAEANIVERTEGEENYEKVIALKKELDEKIKGYSMHSLYEDIYKTRLAMRNINGEE